MLPKIEYSEKDLLCARIKSLELEFRRVLETIDYRNKIIFEIELGRAYKELMNYIIQKT